MWSQVSDFIILMTTHLKTSNRDERQSASFWSSSWSVGLFFLPTADQLADQAEAEALHEEPPTPGPKV